MEEDTLRQIVEEGVRKEINSIIEEIKDIKLMLKIIAGIKNITVNKETGATKIIPIIENDISKDELNGI